MLKTCTKCHTPRPFSEFSKDSQKTSGLRPSCKVCETQAKAARYVRDRPKVLAKQKEWRSANAEVIRQRRVRDVDKRRKRLQRWRANNPDKHRACVHRRVAKVKASPELTLLKNLRTRVGMLIKGNLKSAKTMIMLGCSVEEFKRYLEARFAPGMTWGNYGLWKLGEPMTWHIDHIKPCSAFDMGDPAQQHACFHHTNMQPLWARDNISKNDTWVS